MANGEFIKERLDRALATVEWCAHFPNPAVEILASYSSDHRPLWHRFNPPQKRSPKLFRFEASWSVHDECAEVIRRVWLDEGAAGSSLDVILQKLKRCQESLSSCSSSKFGSFARTLKDLTNKLERLQNKEHPGNLEAIKRLQQEIHQLLEMGICIGGRDRREIGTNWVTEIRSISMPGHHRGGNPISFLRLKIKRGCYGEDIGKAFIQHFQTLFSSDGPTGIDEVILFKPW